MAPLVSKILLNRSHITFLLLRYVQFSHVEQPTKASVKVYITQYAVVAYTVLSSCCICLAITLDWTVLLISIMNI